MCVSLTGSDDANLVISLFAWSCGVESVITRVNATAYEKLLNNNHHPVPGLDTAVAPRDKHLSLADNHGHQNILSCGDLG